MIWHVRCIDRQSWSVGCFETADSPMTIERPTCATRPNVHTVCGKGEVDQRAAEVDWFEAEPQLRLTGTRLRC